LKYIEGAVIGYGDNTLNRTILELKYGELLAIAKQLGNPQSHHTGIEIHLMTSLFLLKLPSIAPYWN
jgi:hypothetical protein